REALKNADVLLTRSSTQVNADLLEGTPIRFAATATIGDDHFDKVWLENHGIAFANAAGSSTGSVIEYMITVLLELHTRKLISIPETALGIIGAGRIGGSFEKLCQAFGMQVLVSDPPRQRVEGDHGFSSLDELLDQADILSLHTPLTREGEDATWHLLNQDRLQRFQGRGIINAGRGAVVDNEALADWLDGDASRWAVLDCWENEPAISHRLLSHSQVIIATPHIAGHSLEGKAANTQFVYDALCRYLGIDPAWDMQDHLPAPEPEVIRIETGNDHWANLHAVVTRLYPLQHDVDALRATAILDIASLAEAFTALRRHYPVRRAWHIPRVCFLPPHGETVQLAQVIGMRLE
ncbi:MAG: 4-phosphoerythronate dehydrogenase, partial [Mariprofundaceae bacterium]